MNQITPTFTQDEQAIFDYVLDAVTTSKCADDIQILTGWMKATNLFVILIVAESIREQDLYAKLPWCCKIGNKAFTAMASQFEISIPMTVFFKQIGQV